MPWRTGWSKTACGPVQLERMATVVEGITREVDGTSTVIDMALASVTLERVDRRSFAPHGLAACVDAALARYPFQPGERERVRLAPMPRRLALRGLGHAAGPTCCPTR